MRELVGVEQCVSSLPFDLPLQDLHMEVGDVERGFRNLSEGFRSTFAHIVLDGEKYHGAAEHFHCNIGTVKSWVSRSRTMMREMLADR